MKSPFKILTTAAVAAALVAGGIAGAAPANAATTQTVTPTVAVTSALPGPVPALTASVPITVNSSAGIWTDLSAVIQYNGATYSSRVFQDQAGNVSVDLISAVSAAVFNYGTVAAGTYTVAIASTQDDGYDANDVSTTYLATSSAPFAFTVTKLATTITGWKTKSKSAKYGKLIKISSPTIHGVGPSAKVIFQYKKKGAHAWKTDESTTTSAYQGATLKLTTQKFNSVHVHGKLKRLKRGTYYFRLVVKSSAYVNGATTKQIKLTCT